MNGRYKYFLKRNGQYNHKSDKSADSHFLFQYHCEVWLSASNTAIKKGQLLIKELEICVFTQ